MIIKSFLTETCFGSSYRAIFKLSPKKVVILMKNNSSLISLLTILKTLLYYSPYIINFITYNL